MREWTWKKYLQMDQQFLNDIFTFLEVDVVNVTLKKRLRNWRMVVFNFEDYITTSAKVHHCLQ